MVFVAFSLPMSIIIAMRSNQYGYAFAGILIVGVYLSFLRFLLLLRYLIKHRNTGFCPIFLVSLLFAAPVIMLAVTGAIAMIYIRYQQVSWRQVFYSMVVTKLLSLPLLLMMKTSFLLVATAIFLQTSIGFFLLASFLDGYYADQLELKYAVIPFVTALLSLLIIRRYLSALIDCCLIIR